MVPRPIHNEITARSRVVDLETLSDEQKLALALDLLDEVSSKMEQRLAWRADVTNLVDKIKRC